MEWVVKKSWSRRQAMMAALALIFVTNAVALFGVWSNRTGEVESRLEMSERELWPISDYVFDGENSATALRLRWRIPVDDDDEYSVYRRSYANSGGVAEWFDRAKLESLNFDLKEPEDDRRSYYYDQLSKEVLLVLEFNGDAYQREIDHAREVLRHEESADSDDAEKKKEQIRRVKRAKEMLAEEENKNSRLFIVDAGLDIDWLRKQYPDRSRYAIVKGEVEPWLVGRDENERVMGRVVDVAIDRIHVPYDYRKKFESMYDERRRVRSNDNLRYRVELAFGQRLEPWIIMVGSDVGTQR